MTIRLSSSPTADAKYAGSSTCLACHKDREHWRRTAHKLGWTVPDAPARAQDFSRHPQFFAALVAAAGMLPDRRRDEMVGARDAGVVEVRVFEGKPVLLEGGVPSEGAGRWSAQVAAIARAWALTGRRVRDAEALRSRLRRGALVLGERDGRILRLSSHRAFPEHALVTSPWIAVGPGVSDDDAARLLRVALKRALFAFRNLHSYGP
jgi:hypothetical protein